MTATTCDRRTTRDSSTVNSDFINYNGGIVFKPVPIGSLYAAYATSTNPFGSELDATGGDYGGSCPERQPSLAPSATGPPKSAPSGSCSIATCW